MRTAAFPDDEPIDDRPFKATPHLGRIDRCLAAPELRARQTCERLQLDVTDEPALRECDYGRWRGRSFPDIQQSDGEAALLAWTHDPAAAPHGGEALLAMFERVAGWLDGQAAFEGHSIVVTHASVIRALAMRVIGAPAAAFWRIDIAPLSCSTLSFNRQWRLRSLGCEPG